MKRQELIQVIAVNAGITRVQARVWLDIFLSEVSRVLGEGKPVKLPGLGTFSVLERPERFVTDFLTGRPVKIPPRKVARFTPAKTLVEQVSQVFHA